MDHFTWQLVALLTALMVTVCLTGAGIYEQSVLDTPWPRKPSIVRPLEGGANRKFFWVPANIVAVLALLLAIWAVWPVAGACNAWLVAVGLFVVMNAVTVAYFAPAVLPPDDPPSFARVQCSPRRTPLSLGTNAALGFAVATVATSAT